MTNQPRYEIVMKSETDFRIFDNVNRDWIYITYPNQDNKTIILSCDNYDTCEDHLKMILAE